MNLLLNNDKQDNITILKYDSGSLKDCLDDIASNISNAYFFVEFNDITDITSYSGSSFRGMGYCDGGGNTGALLFHHNAHSPINVYRYGGIYGVNYITVSDTEV